jgi:hypothetical protein
MDIDERTATNNVTSCTKCILPERNVDLTVAGNIETMSLKMRI